MAKRGAQLGNTNAGKGREWTDALRLALKTYKRLPDVPRGHALRTIAHRVVAGALEGDKDSWQEIGNRLDGKPAQAITGADGGPLQISEIRRTVVG